MPSSDATNTAVQDARAINFAWLLRLRWGAIAGQIVIVAIVETLFRADLPLIPLAAIFAVEAASNVACAAWARRPRQIADWTMGVLMAADVALFTALLALTGGAFNPFSFLYLVYIALAAVVLPPGWSWTLAGVSLACFAALFVGVGMPASGSDPHANHLQMHLQGMWFAFAVAAAFIVYFVQRVTRALATREAELSAARALTARHEKLASLATLAAGAAHQLATPLSTIAVVARELEDQLARLGRADDAVADAQLIREQVERCREILLQMAADAGESTGEPMVTVSVETLVDAALHGVRERARTRVAIDAATRGRAFSTPLRSLAQALRAVVKNALDASAADTPVEVHARASGDWLHIEVVDWGHGMSADVLHHAGEPFFTTKGPDRGMGLGLFLTRAVVERLGGSVELTSEAGLGTTAALRIPSDLAATTGRIAPRDAGTAS